MTVVSTSKNVQIIENYCFSSHVKDPPTFSEYVVCFINKVLQGLDEFTIGPRALVFV